MKGVIPSYYEIRDKINGAVDIFVNIKSSFNRNIESKDYNKLFEVLKFIKDKQYRPDKIYFYFYGYNDKFDSFEIPYNNLLDIDNVNDIKRFIK